MRFAIKVDCSYAPFSRRSPVSFPIPGTGLRALISPSRLLIDDFLLELPLGGRVRSFSAFLDLKKGEIRVYIQAGSYFRYSIKAVGQQITIRFDRGLKQVYKIDCPHIQRPKILEELSCGIYKKQEIEKIQERGDLREILPLWFVASQWYPESGQLTNVVEDFQDHGLAFFPLQELRCCLIADDTLKIPTPCGRSKNLKYNDLLIDMEWSNGRLKKVILHPQEDGQMALHFPANSCRLSGSDRLKKGQLLSYKKGIKLFLDRFE